MKDKAKELVDKFEKQEIHYFGSEWNGDFMEDYNACMDFPHQTAKECALICVDEIINYTPLTSYPLDYIKKHGAPIGSKNWYHGVRKEIELL